MARSRARSHAVAACVCACARVCRSKQSFVDSFDEEANDYADVEMEMSSWLLYEVRGVCVCVCVCVCV